jgi:hypothetical protein
MSFLKTTAIQHLNGSTPAINLTANGRVGIGTSSPGSLLHVSAGSVRLTDLYQIEWGGSRNCVYGSESNNQVGIYTNNIERFFINSSGYAIKPYQPSFLVWSNYASSSGPSGDYVFANVDHNTGSAYSTSTGRFTAPISGRYLMMCGILSRANSMMNISLRKNGSVLVYSEDSRTGNYGEANISVVVNLVAGDYTNINLGFTSYGAAYDWFSGYLLG